ncbi:site-specific integrase [Desulfovibrio sp. JY]|nr:site-specific integrase [Desulfovibrio sp. JY]
MPSLLRRNGTKRWCGAVMVNGQRSSHWLPDASKDSERAAAAWEAAEKVRLKNLQAGVQTIPLVSWTVLRLATEAGLHSKVRDSARTYAEKYRVLKRFVLSIGPDTLLEAVDVDAAETFLNKQAETRGGNAANKDRKNLTWAWNWAKKRFRRQGFPGGENPFQAVQRYAENRCDRYVPTPEDFAKVLARQTGQDRTMLLAALHLAARKGELFRLNWDDVDFSGCKVRLTSRKTRSGSWKQDWLPMTPELKASMQELRDTRANAEGPVFQALGAFAFDRQYAGEAFSKRNHWLKRECARAGVKEFGLHAVRHLSAVMLYHAGKSVATIQAMLRHENAGTTEVYLKRLGLDPGKLREAIEDVFSRGKISTPGAL